MRHKTFFGTEGAQMISDSAIKHTRIYQALVVVLPLLTNGCSTHVAKKEPTKKDVLEAPAADLAQGYLAAKTSLGLVKTSALGGPGASVTFNIRGETINKDNVDEYRAKYQKQLSLYKEAIKQRGYANIAGTYKGEATKSCASSNSLWAAVIQENAQTGVEIRQEGIDAQIVIRVQLNDEEMSIENPAAIVETTIAVIDAMNSEYYFQGEIKDQAIVLKPNISALKTWPKWASPPSRDDLENCTITLQLS